jgi:ZIP family zinc transporter
MLLAVSAWTVSAATLAAALACGLGALPLLAFRSQTRHWLAPANALASGFMLAAAAVLAYEARERLALAAGVALGALSVLLTRRLLAGRELEVGQLQGADALKAVTIVAVMTIHSFSEGAAMGVSYGDGARLGLFITLAIALHNLPEGLAVSLVLVPRGTRVRTAAWWSVFTSLPQPLIAIPAFLLVESFRGLLSWGLGFGAGAMLALVVSELIPESREEGLSWPALAAWSSAAFALMVGLQLWLS